MGTLNLRKPNLKTGRFGRRKTEQYEYLQLNLSLGLDELQEDVEAGAKQYAVVAEALQKNLSRVILVNSDNREEGLGAVSYLMSVLAQDRIYVSPEKEPDYKAWDSGMDDFFDQEEMWDEDEEDDESSVTEWVERIDRIPVVAMSDIRAYCNGFDENDGVYPVMLGGLIGVARADNGKNGPYWANCDKQAICIDRGKDFSPWKAEDIKLLDMFAGNKRVILLNYGNEREENIAFVSEEKRVDIEYEEYRDFICELLLYFSADTINVHMEEGDRREFYNILFQDWVEEYGLHLGKDVDTQGLVDQILELRRNDKSFFMEQLVRYLVKKGAGKEVLTTGDLEASEIFQMLCKSRDSLEPAIAKMERTIVGQDRVKQQVLDYVNTLKYVKRCKQMGIPVEDYHSVYMLVGPPGTAKTTIAKLMGTMMKEERLLPNDRFISINGAELKGKYVGHSAPRTKAIFDEYDIIFIDEAYSITSSQFGEMDSFGQEAMAQLMIELEKHSQDKLVIFAGYGGPDVLEKDNKMKAFVNANPGLRSRISATISFSAYSPEDMLAIVHRQAGNMGLQLEEKADPCILEYFRERTQDSNFGNGREGRSFLENCMVSVAGRIMKLPVSEQTMKCMTTILEEDVKDSIKRMREGLNAQICQTGKYGFLQGEN
jgi:hypothetical protein